MHRGDGLFRVLAVRGELQLVAFLGVFLLLPVYTVVEVGCDWRFFAEIFRNQVYLEGLWNSLRIALVSFLCTTWKNSPCASAAPRNFWP